MTRKILIAVLCVSLVFTTFLNVSFAADELPNVSGTFTADDTQNNNEAWNILASSTDKTHSFSKWMNSVEDYGGNGRYCLAAGKVAGADTPDYWIVTGGVAEGSEIKSFEIRARDKSCVKILGSGEADGEYTEVALSSEAADGENGSSSGYAPKKILKYDMKGLGYKYIKIQSLATEWGNAIFGRYTYTYDVIEKDPDKPVGPDDPVIPPAEGGRGEISDFTSFSTLNIVKYNGFKITKQNLFLADGSTLYHDARLEATQVGSNWYFIVEIPEKRTAEKFVLDVGREAKNRTKVSVSKTLDGEYVEVKGTWGDTVNFATGTGYVGSEYCLNYTPARFSNLPSGTRYIKVQLGDDMQNSYVWSHWFGKMVYYWGDVEYYDNTVAIEKFGNTGTLTNTITPKYDDLDSINLKAFCTVYDEEGKLLYISTGTNELKTSAVTFMFKDLPQGDSYTTQLVYISNNENFSFPLSPILSVPAQ